MERRAVVQAEFAAEVEHREAVGKDEKLARRVFAQVGKARVQRFELRAVVIAVRAVKGFVGRVRFADRVADGANEQNGVLRRCPDVLVVLDRVAVVRFLVVVVIIVLVMVVMPIVVVVMVVPVRALHSLDIFLIERVDIVHHARNDGDVFPRRVEHTVDPVFPLAAVVEEDVGLGDRDGVERRGLEAVRLAPGREQERHIRALTDDGAGKVVIGEKRCDDLKLSVVRFFRRCSAGAERKCQHERQK